MSKSERRKICCSVFFHIVAITCVVWSLYVLIEKTTSELQNGKLHWPFWTKLAVVAVGLTGGIAFMYVQCKTYFNLWARLKAFNQIISVQNRLDHKAEAILIEESINDNSSTVIAVPMTPITNRTDHSVVYS